VNAGMAATDDPIEAPVLTPLSIARPTTRPSPLEPCSRALIAPLAVLPPASVGDDATVEEEEVVVVVVVVRGAASGGNMGASRTLVGAGPGVVLRVGLQLPPPAGRSMAGMHLVVSMCFCKGGGVRAQASAVSGCSSSLQVSQPHTCTLGTGTALTITTWQHESQDLGRQSWSKQPRTPSKTPRGAVRPQGTHQHSNNGVSKCGVWHQMLGVQGGPCHW
jgi:hypothetical protein